MNEIVISGRLLSENRGTDEIINFTLRHPDLKLIIVCGKVNGHRAGHSLLALVRNGMDLSGSMIGAAGHYPTLKSSAYAVDAFRRQVQILDMIGVLNIDKIARVLVA